MEIKTGSACSSLEDYEIYKTFSAINLFISLSNVATNGLLSYVLWKLKKITTISYRFIFVQSMCDILVGSALMVSRLVSYRISFTQFCHLKTYADIVCDCLCMFSGIMVSLIALDRYIHMRYLNQYSIWMTQRRATMLIILNGSLCLIVGIVQVLAYLGGWHNLVLLILNCIAILLIVGTSTGYLYAYKSLHLRTKQVDFDRSLPKNTNRAKPKRNPTKEFLKAMIAILSAFMICFTPFVIMSALKFATRNQTVSETKTTIILFYISRLFVCANSSLNAILYLTLNRELRVYALHSVSFGHFEYSTSTNPPQENASDRVACTHSSGCV